MRIGRWSDRSAEHEVRYTGNEILCFHDDQGIGIYERVILVGESGPKIRQEFSSA